MADGKAKAFDRPGDVTAPDPSRTAVFLDFDGTLVDLADRPDGVVVDGGLTALLAAVAARFAGGVTILSGRALRDLQRFLPGHDGPLIGGHGAETRIAGEIRAHPFADDPRLPDLIARSHDWVRGREGLLIEEKRTGVVIHWRHAPDRGDEVRAFLSDLIGDQGDLDLHAAKLAHEVRPADADKGSALRRALQAGPTGRAVMIGDDASDEPAMRAAVESGGLSVKVGDGPTGAPWRLRDPAAVREMLALWAGAPA